MDVFFVKLCKLVESETRRLPRAHGVDRSRHELDEQVPLVRGEPGKRSLVLRGSRIERIVAQGSGLGRQPDLAGASVDRMRASSNEAITLHAPQRVGHRGLLDIEPFDQLLLSEPVVLPQLEQRRKRACGQSQGPDARLKPVGEEPRHVIDEVPSLRETMITTTMEAAGLVAVSAVFGGMAFFAFVYAPLVFIKLGTETGGRFLREVFPVYYVAMGAVSIAAAGALAFASAARGADALAMACIGIVFFLARFVLLPVINRSRDAGHAGDIAAQKRFDRLHRLSVGVNLVQMLAVLAVLVRYAGH